MRNDGKPRAAKKKRKRAAPEIPASAGAAPGDAPLIAKAREIIDQTSEVRPEKVAALKEAIAQGTYEIDSRKLASILITKLFLEP